MSSETLQLWLLKVYGILPDDCVELYKIGKFSASSELVFFWEPSFTNLVPFLNNDSQNSTAC